MESKFDYWNRQTLREKPARILADWKAERESMEDQHGKDLCRGYEWSASEINKLISKNTELKKQLSEARDLLARHIQCFWNDCFDEDLDEETQIFLNNPKGEESE